MSAGAFNLAKNIQIFQRVLEIFSNTRTNNSSNKTSNLSSISNSSTHLENHLNEISAHLSAFRSTMETQISQTNAHLSVIRSTMVTPMGEHKFLPSTYSNKQNMPAALSEQFEAIVPLITDYFKISPKDIKAFP